MGVSAYGSCCCHQRASALLVNTRSTVSLTGIQSLSKKALPNLPSASSESMLPKSHTPKNEPGQPFSQQSTKHLAGLVLNKVVDVKSHGPDRYGRTLGEVFLDGNNINLEMVKSGLAEVYRGTPAKGQNMEPYWKAEERGQEGREGNVGAGGQVCEPPRMEADAIKLDAYYPHSRGHKLA